MSRESLFTQEPAEGRQKDAPLKPEFCCFGITEQCMLRCRMCYKWKDDILLGPNPPQPAADVWMRALRELRTFADDSLTINFGGGEALLYPFLPDVVTQAHALGFRTNIASNGWLIDETMARRITDCGLTHINLSLDSLREKTHDYLRGVEGVYRRVMQAIDLLSRAPKGPQLFICAVIYDINAAEIIELAEWVNNHPSLEAITFMAPMQPNNTVPDERWYEHEYSFLWPKDTAKVLSVLDRLVELKKRGWRIGNEFCELEAFRSYFVSPENFVKDRPCNMWRALHVSSIGDIFLCYNWEKLGNITRDNLARAWSCARAECVRERIKRCRQNCHFLLNCFYRKDD